MRFSFSRNSAASDADSASDQAQPEGRADDFVDTTPPNQEIKQQTDRTTDGQFIDQLCVECALWIAQSRQALELALDNKKTFRLAALQLSHAMDQMATLLEIGRLYAYWEINGINKRPKKTPLHTLIESRLTEHIPAFRAHGQQVRRKLKPVELLADSQLLVTLVDAAIRWSITTGDQLDFRLDIMTWPAHGRWLIKTQRTALPPGESAPEHDNPEGIAWRLLKRLASHAGVTVETVFGGGECVLTLLFPQVVVQYEGISVLEVEAGDHAHTQQMSWETAAPMTGTNVLVICDDTQLRTRIRQALKQGKLEVEAVGSIRQAMGVLSIQNMEAIVIVEDQIDALFYEVRDQILSEESTFPFIVITAGADAYHISSPDNESPCTVGVKDLERQLLPALLLELAKS